MRRPFLAGVVATALTITPAPPAEAFSTRVHIVIANRLREATIAGQGSIELWQGGDAVVLSAEDARAIEGEPEAFRAGAVGPDNMMFPGLTDPSHAIRQRPFEQCERLYQSAVLDKERAYAMGCFLHGSTDAVAHHFVNYLSGETFTLNPISSSRQLSFSNVSRHILAEDLIATAAFELDPMAFSGSAFDHSIPKGFVLRTYFDIDSPVYELMGAHAVEAYLDAWEADPTATLPEIIVSLDVAPADHLVLVPVYVEEIDLTRVWLRSYIEDEIATMQDWGSAEGSVLLVTPGPDFTFGTKDDETDCTVTCAQLFSKYFIFTGLLEPRQDASGNPLPPAWDKVSDKFGADLRGLAPALVEVVENLSNRLNTPLSSAGGGVGDLATADIAAAFEPLTDWAVQITTIDTQSIAIAVSPEWLTEMDVFFQSFGIDVDVSAWVEALLEPVIAPIRDGIRTMVIDRAKVFIDDLATEFRSSGSTTLAEYRSRLADALPPGLDGPTSLEHFYDSGLYGHAFNLSAVALANHATVLPVGDDPVGIGPASFDCSHTTRWMQAGACDYISRLVFPLGQDVDGALSVLQGGTERRSPLTENSPIECHDGSLSAFASEPTVATCELTYLDDLLVERRGTITRSHPPELGSDEVKCMNFVVPGLPLPSEGTGGGGESGDGYTVNEGGCDCRTASTGFASGRASLALVLAALLGLMRRRARDRR